MAKCLVNKRLRLSSEHLGDSLAAVGGALVILLAGCNAGQQTVERDRPPLTRPTLSAAALADIEESNEDLRAEARGLTSEGVLVDPPAARGAAAPIADGAHAGDGSARGSSRSAAPAAPDFEEELREPSDPKAIFGPDGRGTPKQQIPYELVGKLFFEHGHCTAALVGPRHILTAAHCFERTGPNTLSGAVFVPYYEMGRQPYGGARVTTTYYGAIPPEVGSSEDWAVCVLDRRLGDELGWFGARTISDAWFEHPTGRREDNTEFVTAGYSGDWYNGEALGADWRTWLYWRSPEDPLVVAHDGDTTPGASGGPVFSRFPGSGWQIVGVTITGAQRLDAAPGEIARWPGDAPYHGVANLCVDMARVIDAIRQARREHP